VRRIAGMLPKIGERPRFPNLDRERSMLKYCFVATLDSQITEKPAGYLELLRSNKNFRNLWLGQVISELGDWFSTVALLNLMLEVTARAQSIAWFFIVIYIPGMVVGPAAGVLVDRLNRKKLMISMDIIRAFLVLGYLAVRSADQIWILYVVAALEVSMMTLFEPARTAAIPNICRTRELVAANAIGSITWSTVLTVGAAIGGLVTAVFGRNVCYILDSLSFLISAFFISRVSIRFGTLRLERPLLAGAASGFADILEGLSYIRSRPRVIAAILVKSAWGLGGGAVLLLSVFGQKIFPLLGSGAAGIGAIYAARGIGAGLGPVVARRIAGEKRRALRNYIATGFFLAGLFYMAFGHANTFILAALALMIAHMGGSMLWVFSTVLLQLDVPDDFRGRVFALDFVLFTLGFAVSNYFTGHLMDVDRLDPRTIATLLGAYFLFPGILWLFFQRMHRS
jgi:MFS family permease